MAATQGTVALLDRAISHGVAQKSSSSQHYAKSIPMVVPVSRRVYSGVTVSSAANQSSLGRGDSIKANAVATAPGLRKSVGGYSPGHDYSEKAVLAPSWAVLTDEISIGPCPRSAKDLKSLTKNTNINAIIFLETAEGCKKIGLDWNSFREKASEQGVVAVRISMNDDQQDQASTLPEAVRAAAALAALGYKVHVTCTSGVYRSPLVALGFLTFLKGMEFNKAVQLISQENPAAQPSLDAWEEAKSKISAGEMKRVAQLANAVAQKRLKAGQTAGAPTDDWLVAQRLLVAEAFERGIMVDVHLSDAIAQAATIRATKSVVEDLKVSKAEAEKAKSMAASSKERLDFFARQLQALKEKEESARKNAVTAIKDKDSLSRQVESLKVREAQATKGAEAAREQVAALTQKVAELQKQETLLKATAEEAVAKAKELQVEISELRASEAAARKELVSANAKLQTLSVKYSSMEASMADAQGLKERASDRVQEVVNEIKNLKPADFNADALAAKVAELAKKEAAANSAFLSAQERLAFSERHMLTLKEKELSAREAVRAADEKARRMADKMQDLTRREAAAVEATKKANEQIAALQQKLAQLSAAGGEASQATAAIAVGDVSSELTLSRKREAKALESVAAASDKLGFLERRLELLQQRDNKAAQAAEERILAFSHQAAELRTKLADADVAAKEQEQKIEDLSLQVEELQKSELKAQEAVKITAERMGFFQRSMELLKQKETAAREAAAEATKKLKVLQKTVEDLARREMFALSQVKELTRQVATLLEANTELGTQLDDLKSREAKLAQALDDGSGVLQIALQADETLKQLRQEAEKAAQELLESRLRADRLAADLERELVAAGKKPKHYNDVEKVPSSEIEQQLVAQLASMQNTITATGGSAVAALTTTAEPSSQLELLRNLVLGALGVAAVPVTLMSVFSSSPSPSMMSNTAAQMSNTAATNTESAVAAPNQLIVKGPIIQPASAEDFCKSTPSGQRSARAERFCNSLADIEID